MPSRHRIVSDDFIVVPGQVQGFKTDVQSDPIEIDSMIQRDAVVAIAVNDVGREILRKRISVTDSIQSVCCSYPFCLC